MTSDEKIEAWNLVESLRAAEGNSVTLVCDNPDFNGQQNNAVDCCGGWSEWGERRFSGDTILEALRSAHEAMVTSEHNSLYGRTE